MYHQPSSLHFRFKRRECGIFTLGQRGYTGYRGQGLRQHGYHNTCPRDLLLHGENRRKGLYFIGLLLTNPMALWPYDSLVRRPINPTVHWSSDPPFLLLIDPTHWIYFALHWSYDQLALRLTGPMPYWSDSPLILQIGAHVVHRPLIPGTRSPSNQ